MLCPRCKTEVHEVAHFCPRCHNTLRFKCPACAHEQRQGGSCEECGVNFLKYITALVTTKRGEAALSHARLERRSSLLKNLLLFPVNLGIPLLRRLVTDNSRRRET